MVNAVHFRRYSGSNSICGRREVGQIVEVSAVQRRYRMRRPTYLFPDLSTQDGWSSM